MKFPKNSGGFGDMMRQAQEAMQQAQKLEDELAKEQLPIEKGPVKAIFTGKGEILSLKIDPVIIDPEEAEMLEDLILSVVRDGITQANELRASRLQKLMPGLPGM